MNLLKASVLDGMAPIFFQRFWPTIGNSITQAIIHALNLGVILNPSTILMLF